MAGFEDLQRSLWEPGSERQVQLPLTDQSVLEAERLLDVRLPAALLALLRVQNGGVVADGRAAFPTARATSWSEDHVPFDIVMGIGHREGTISILDSPYLVEEWGLPTEVVLISGDGHCWVGLDYRVSGRLGEPSVTWFDADDGSELALAADFQTFIESLTSVDGFDGVQDEVGAS
jgi:hypothetical protein